jgi:hypothetical protein
VQYYRKTYPQDAETSLINLEKKRQLEFLKKQMEEEEEEK